MIDWQAIWLTARLAACTALLLLVLGLPLAFWLATTRWWGRIFVEAIVAVPLVLPPTVIGFYVLVALGPRCFLGRWLEGITGHLLPFSFGGLLTASVLYSLPFAVQPFTAAIRTVDWSLVDAAKTMGAGRWQALGKVVLPLAMPGITAGMVLSFAHTLGEFGVVLMVGGNIAGQTRTISIAIYDQVQSLDYTSAALNSFVLLGASFVILTLTYFVQHRFFRLS